MSNSNLFLIRSLQEGNVKTFEKVYKLYYSKLYGFSKKFDLTTLEPDDFVQQTFLKLWEEREQLNERVLFDKQLYVICRNLILNHLKREKKMVSERSSVFLNVSDGFVDEDISEDLEKLRVVIKKMPDKRKEVFLLHKMENLTYQEISEYLCISKKTIANHIYLASSFLKEEIRKPRDPIKK